ncbi:MAG: CADD family putative folate metabolism protein [Alphaproteobacteria bacterium]|nr:CADD family putative folate metabolism protein [Alphaproteobacteria bacterium]
MNNFAEFLAKEIKPYNLLNHPFYKSWNEGVLEKETIKDYAKQYYHHVKAFPRYISSAHSICEDIEKRKILLENLNDEENNGTDHPTLWKNFALGTGNDEKSLDGSSIDSYTKNLIDTFFKNCRSSYAEALASIYTYEHQVPEIARTKIEGLEKHYGVTDKKSLEFFHVHEKADIWHREQCESLLDQLTEEEQKKALASAKETAKALWGFLSGVALKHGMITKEPEAVQ